MTRLDYMKECFISWFTKPKPLTKDDLKPLRVALEGLRDDMRKELVEMDQGKNDY